MSFGAIEEDEKGTPFYKINRAAACATCMGACPERIVSFKDYSVDIIGSMLKAGDVPEIEDEDDPKVPYRIIGLIARTTPCRPWMPRACISCVWIRASVSSPALHGVLQYGLGLGRLSKGVDGMILLGCKYGDDYQCHFAKGSELLQLPLEQALGNPGQAGTGIRPGAAIPDSPLRLRQTAADHRRFCGPDQRSRPQTLQGILGV